VAPATFGYSHLSGVGLNPTEAQLTRYLRQLCRHRIRPRDYLVVYIAGHGEVLEGGRHVLLTADTDPRDVPNGLSTVQLADKMLLGTPVQRLLLLLDTCYSGQGGNQLAAAVLAGMERDWTGDRSGLVVITSSQPFEQANAGAFPDLLTQAVHGLPTAGHLPPTLDLDAVVHAIRPESSTRCSPTPSTSSTLPQTPCYPLSMTRARPTRGWSARSTARPPIAIATGPW
jgi:hypothetical protein